MKNASEIINSLQNRPQFARLSYYKCIQKVKSMFVPPVQKMINFGYIKNRTMFLVFNHPIGKQEFDNNIQSIKSALKFYMPPECKECDTNLFDDIKAFVTHTPKRKYEEQKDIQISYKERSSGNFEVNIKDEKLCLLVRTIQTIIKSRHDT